MTATVPGIHAGRVVIVDDEGQGEIPVDCLDALVMSPAALATGRVWFEGHTYSRADLVKADQAFVRGDLLALPNCHRCVDGAATTTDHRDRPVCLPCAPRDED